MKASEATCPPRRETAKARTERLFKEIFEKLKAEGLSPDQAAARAIQMIQSGKTEVASDEKMQVDQPSSSKIETDQNLPTITTDANDFTEYLANESIEELHKYLKNVFGSVENLAHSFRLDSGKGVDYDWDGLKRVYEDIEAKDLENSLVEAIGELNNSISKTKSKSKIIPSLVMTLVNPSVASPCYLLDALPNICSSIHQICSDSQLQQLDFVELFSKIPVPDLLQIVKNIQQAITIRCIEFDEDVQVHEDEQIADLVVTLQLLFYANLLITKNSSNNDWRKDMTESTTLLNKPQPNVNDDDDDDDIDGVRAITEDERAIESLLYRKTNRPKITPKNIMEEKLNINWCRISSPAIPFVEFTNEVVNNALNVQEDFLSTLRPRASILFSDPDEDDIFSFKNYPFILNIENKTKFLFFDSKVKQIQNQREASYQMLTTGVPQHPYLCLTVSRENIVQDTLMRLEIVAADNPDDLQKQLFVEFDGEQGIDEGGLSKEFFTLVIAQIFKPDYGMFYLNHENDYYFFNRVQFQETEKEYMLIGMLIGLAIYNSIILDIAFPTVIFKKLSGELGEFQDLEYFEPDIYRNMTQLLEYPAETVDSLELTFTAPLTSVFGDTVEHELVPDGKNVKVNERNRHRYVDLYADFLLNKSIEKSFNAFQRGFELVTCNSPLASLFRPEELEEMVIGQRQYDWDAFKKSCSYDGGFNIDHPTIKNFWSVFEELDQDERKAFLEFFTGSDRVPIGGLGKLKPKIQSSGPDSDRLPTAHTCFNILLLPAYESRDKLKDRLLKAIQNAKGFGMI